MATRIALTLAAGAIASSCSPVAHGSAYDVAFLSAEHFVVARWDGGVVTTRDGGTSWKYAKTVPIRQLAVGPDGQLWGFYRWQGIHEPSTAALTVSTDGGRRWTTIELDPEEVMPTAFINENGERPLLLAADGQIWTMAGKALHTWAAWERLGTPNPDGSARAGLAREDVLFVASSNRVWQSIDAGQTWSSVELHDIALFAYDLGECWAMSADGRLYRSDCLRNGWKPVLEISAIHIPFGLAASESRIYVAAHGNPWIAYCARVDRQGVVTPLAGLRGKQALAVRIDPSGVAWCVADGLHRESGDEWVRVWPKP